MNKTSLFHCLQSTLDSIMSIVHGVIVCKRNFVRCLKSIKPNLSTRRRRILNILSSYQKEVNKQLRTRNLRFVELSSDIPVVLVSNKHPLYQLGDFSMISPRDLANYPLVRYSTMDYTHYGDKAHLVGITKHAGEIIVDTRSSLHEILDNTDAFAVVSYNEKLYSHFNYYPHTHRLLIENCTLTHKFGWIMREDAVLSPLAKRFIQMLTAYF